MIEDAQDNGFWAQWKSFLQVLLDPWVLLLAAVAFYSGKASLGATPSSAAGALALVSSIASGLLGGRIAQRWGALTEEQVIAARGKAAVRGLKLHLGSVADLEKRSRVFLARCSGKSNMPDASFPCGMALEDVVGRCRLLEEQVLSSIENWTDIVPEANIKTQIGEITRLAQENDEQVEEVGRLQAALSDSKNQSVSTQQTLQAEIERKEKLLKETRRKLAESSSLLGPFTGSSGYVGKILGGSILWNRICTKCGRQYASQDLVALSDLLHPNLCQDCQGAPAPNSSSSG